MRIMNGSLFGSSFIVKAEGKYGAVYLVLVQINHFNANVLIFPEQILTGLPSLWGFGEVLLLPRS